MTMVSACFFFPLPLKMESTPCSFLPLKSSGKFLYPLKSSLPFKRDIWVPLKSYGDRGVRVKKIMLILFERSQWEETEAFYRISKLICVQRLSHSELRDFSRISYKKIRKSWNLGYFMQNLSGVAILVQFCWNLQQITLSYRLTNNLQCQIFDIFKFGFFIQFCTRKSLSKTLRRSLVQK